MPDAEFVVYEPTDCRVASWFAGAANLSVRKTPIPSEGRTQKFLANLRYWRSALRAESFDVFEGFNLPLVKPPSGRTLLTIHDIRGVHPGAGVANRLVFTAVLKRALRAADHVLTVSEAMKQEILSVQPGIPVSVIYNGLDAGPFEYIAPAELSAVRLKHALPEDFILSVGHFEQRKNYLRLIEAAARLRDHGRACALVLVGNDSGLRKSLEERVASVKLTESVRFLSGLSDLEVRCVYRLCKVFVFPSSYEGFGIPILEAMAARRPMVLSDLPVFREITQGHGVYFPPDDVEAMASSIERVLTAPTEAARLVDYGGQRIGAFGFERLGAQLEGLYRSLT